jgi:hypothetical protein
VVLCLLLDITLCGHILLNWDIGLFNRKSSCSKWIANNLWVKRRGFSAFNLIVALPLTLYPAYHYFLHLLSTNHKCTQPCYFPMLLKPVAQKLKETLDSMMKSSRWVITPGQLSVELWCRSAAVSSRVFALVFCKTLFGNKYIILWHWLFCIHFLYGMCVNLIPGYTY